jgi:hypothetical protein
METKISKAQIEVWDWKESLYKELLTVPKSERLKYIRDKVSDTIAKIKSKQSNVA